MLAKDTLPFERAFDAFKTADKNLAQLAERFDDAKAQLLNAKLELAGTDAKVQNFARNGSADTKSAAVLVSQQAQARDVVALLERSVEFLTTEIASAKVDVAAAERSCTEAQAAYHEKIVDDLCADFLRTHAPALQKLTAQLALASTFQSVAQSGSEELRAAHVEDALGYTLRVAAARQFGEDIKFRTGCAPTRSTPITNIVRSTHLGADERQRANMMRGLSRAQIVAELTPKAVQPDPFDLTHATQSARNAAQSAEHHRARVAEYEQRLSRHPGDASEKEYLDMHRREADRYDAIVEHWDELITANRQD